jgi:hypothetical protein
MDLFSRRGDADDDGLPRQMTDAELLAWSAALAAEPTRPPRRAPLRAAPEPIPQRRRRPLVADPA